MTSSEARTRTVAAIVAAIAIALGSSPARAQRSAADVETARELYNSGRTLKEHGDLKGALEKLKAAHALGRTPITGLELARTYAALGQPVDAREVCLGVARLPVSPEETARSAEARVAAAKLAEEVKPKIAALRLRIRGAPPGAEPIVTVDGIAVPAAALTEARQVNPGTHALTARVANGPETKETADLKEGEVRDVELAVTPPREPAAPQAAPSAPARAGGDGSVERRLSPWVIPGFAVAAAGVGVGAVTGVLAASAKSDLNSKCVGSHCGPEAYDTLDRGKLLGNVSTIAFIDGGVGAAAGIYGLTHPVTAGPASPRAAFVKPYVSAGALGIHGSF